MDRWALDAARGLGQVTNGQQDKGPRVPTVKEYNIAVKTGHIAGTFLAPVEAK